MLDTCIKMLKQSILLIRRPVLAMVFASSVVLSGAQSTPPQKSQNVGKPASAPVWQGSQLNRVSQRAEMYYQGVWGVSELRVKTAESGELIRFNYRVLEPHKDAALNDKKAQPAFYDAQ